MKNIFNLEALQILCHQITNPDAQIIENFPYAPMLGSLMYAMICTRPDLSTAVSILSRYTRNPKKIHCQLIQHTFRYARDNSYAIQYKYNSPLKLEGYVDAAYATGQDCKSRVPTNSSNILKRIVDIIFKLNIYILQNLGLIFS